METTYLMKQSSYVVCSVKDLFGEVQYFSLVGILPCFTFILAYLNILVYSIQLRLSHTINSEHSRNFQVVSLHSLYYNISFSFILKLQKLLYNHCIYYCMIKLSFIYGIYCGPRINMVLTTLWKVYAFCITLNGSAEIL
jgi:hypothetical protein